MIHHIENESSPPAFYVWISRCTIQTVVQAMFCFHIDAGPKASLMVHRKEENLSEKEESPSNSVLFSAIRGKKKKTNRY